MSVLLTLLRYPMVIATLVVAIAGGVLSATRCWCGRTSSCRVPSDTVRFAEVMGARGATSASESADAAVLVDDIAAVARVTWLQEVVDLIATLGALRALGPRSERRTSRASGRTPVGAGASG